MILQIKISIDVGFNDGMGRGGSLRLVFGTFLPFGKKQQNPQRSDGPCRQHNQGIKVHFKDNVTLSLPNPPY